MFSGKLGSLLGNVSKVADLENSWGVKWDFAFDHFVCTYLIPRPEVFFLDRGYP